MKQPAQLQGNMPKYNSNRGILGSIPAICIKKAKTAATINQKRNFLAALFK
ncbi:MAG: hypothetical protein JXA38_04655 [Methanosarcinaceae archaeon]|nr:hypothetical protein [Methanosarcinaceae archaeon]